MNQWKSGGSSAQLHNRVIGRVTNDTLSGEIQQL